MRNSAPKTPIDEIKKNHVLLSVTPNCQTSFENAENHKSTFKIRRVAYSPGIDNWLNQLMFSFDLLKHSFPVILVFPFLPLFPFFHHLILRETRVVAVSSSSFEWGWLWNFDNFHLRRLIHWKNVVGDHLPLISISCLIFASRLP